MVIGDTTVMEDDPNSRCCKSDKLDSNKQSELTGRLKGLKTKGDCWQVRRLPM